ncbi:MAG: 2-amino-4-hydroxy-6-hydroxymethyldihydropteridine diphosphokinase [Vampirovibrionales bacterium]|nr:2-amino-4-hydroxy-6-hydroxymethyldihydropteridine diphosphokinase [Vampirovibrionales bacterium]
MRNALIALGSNLDSPEKQLERALALLAALPAINIRAVSPFFNTAPVGYDHQPWFVNAVCWVETPLGPKTLLNELMGIERRMGRVRDPHSRFGPRIIDLDLLMVDCQVFQSEDLTLPHPRMHQRGFVLAPIEALLNTLKTSAEASEYLAIEAWVNANLPIPLADCLSQLAPEDKTQGLKSGQIAPVRFQCLV